MRARFRVCNKRSVGQFLDCAARRLEDAGPPGHIFQFGRKTLAVALESAGFAMQYQATEAIDPGHTVGAFEHALMDVPKGMARRPNDGDARFDAPAPGP